MAQGGAEETFDCLLAKVIQLLSTSDWGINLNAGDLHELHSFILIVYDKDGLSGVKQ